MRPRRLGSWTTTLIALLVVLQLATTANGRRAHSKRYSETAGPQAAIAAQAVTPEEDEDYDSGEAEDDERVYKNPRNSPSLVCPRDEDHAAFLGQSCLRKCSSDEDCKSKKKKCRCDGTCGMSCIKPDRECPELDPLVPGNVTATGRFFGDTATYACEPGMHLVGLRIRTCQADGRWSGTQPTCKQNVYCLTPPPMDHARHNALPSQTTFEVNTMLKYQCHSGYVTNGFPTAKCLAMAGTASWFGPDISCEPRACGQPADPENGWHKASCYTYTCRATYECAKEYELVGRAERICQADGTWSPKDLPSCVLVAEVECPAPENPVNGRAIFTRQAYNSVVSYECNYGYTLVGDATRRCGADRRWSGHKPSCEAPCVVPKIINGTVWPKGTVTNGSAIDIYVGLDSVGVTGTQTVPHGEQLLVRCEYRYEFLNNGTPVLCNNGTWTHIPKCQPARCKRLPKAPRNGYVIAPKTDHGMRAKFACRDGYILNGTDVTECSYGNWTGELPICGEVYCPFPGYVENGKVMLVGNMGLYDYRPYVRKVTNNKQIMYDCDRGYVLSEGPPGATCIGGKWSPSQLPRCVPGKHPRLRWSRSVRVRRAALFAARLKMLSSDRWSAMTDGSPYGSLVRGNLSDNNEDNRLTFSQLPTPRPSVEFEPWGAPKEAHTPAPWPPSGVLQRLLGKRDSPRSSNLLTPASMPVVGHFQPSYPDSHPLYGKPQPAHNGAASKDTLVSWFTADGRTREQARAERAKRALRVKRGVKNDHDHDHDEDNEDDEEDDYHESESVQSGSDESAASASGSSSDDDEEDASDSHGTAAPSSRHATQSPRLNKNETVLSRQARASRTRVGPQVMRANRHRGGDRRKSTKTRKDSTKKTSPGNTVTCESLSTDQYTHIVVTKPGRDHNDSASSGSTVLVSCEVGYQLNIGANISAKCVRGRWKPARPECVIVPCRIPDTEHAIYRRANDSSLLIEDTEVSHDEEVKFSCINGYNPVGPRRLRCVHGEWDVSDLPECVQGEDGDQFRGGDTSADIDLFGEVDKGDRRSCSPPAKVQGSLVYINGHPMREGERSFPDGTEVMFNCMASIMGEKSTWRILCEDGTWVGRSLNCDMEDSADSKLHDNSTCKLRSSEPNVVSFHNDQLITVDVAVLPAGAVVVSRCRDIGKYQLIGSSQRRCVTGEWDGQKPVCFGLNQENDYALEKPPTILFRHDKGPIAQSNDGKLIVYPGVILHMECLWIRRFGTPKWTISHSYSSNNTAVIVVASDSSTNSTNSTDQPQKVYPTGWNSEDGRDSALEFRLSILHASKDDSGEFTCTTPTRHTHSVFVEVKAVHCPQLPEKRGVKYSTTENKMNTKVSMTCDGGTSLIGASEIVCLASGNWSAPFPVCESVECADFGNASDPQLRVLVLSQGVGGQAVFSCPAGYSLVGPSYSVCQANGDWVGPYPVCQVVNCEPPASPEHGYITGQQGQPYRAGDILQFNCNPQYMLEGHAIIACQENGRWSGSVPKCVPACSYPGTAISGRMSDDVKFFYRIGETVTFICDEGLEIKGVSMLRCMKNGKWSNAIPVCVPAGTR